MKKTYIIPTTKIVKIAVQPIMNPASGNIGMKNGTVSKAWAREDNSWDIWDNDEE